MKIIKSFLFMAMCIMSMSLTAQEKEYEVAISGAGHPILFFPGFTCPGEVWEDVVKELSKTNECHVFTFAGFGNVPAIEKPWLPKIKEGISQYILKENLHRPTLIGHSLGGALALWLASDGLFDFDNVIVVDALPSTGALMIPNFDSESIVYENPYNQKLFDMDDESFKVMATQMASGMSLNKEKTEQLTAWMVSADRETYVYGYTDFLKLDLRNTLANIKVPVTILAATQPYGEEAVKDIYSQQYAKLGNYKIKYATESAHFIMYDQPRWLINNIREALR